MNIFQLVYIMLLPVPRAILAMVMVSMAALVYCLSWPGWVWIIVAVLAVLLVALTWIAWGIKDAHGERG